MDTNPTLHGWADQIFPIRLTDSQRQSNGTWHYAWTALYRRADDGELEDSQPPRSGTFVQDPAREVNNKEVDVSSQPVAWARVCGSSGSGQIVVEFVSPGTTASVAHIRIYSADGNLDRGFATPMASGYYRGRLVRWESLPQSGWSHVNPTADPTADFVNVKPRLTWQHLQGEQRSVNPPNAPLLPAVPLMTNQVVLAVKTVAETGEEVWVTMDDPWLDVTLYPVYDYPSPGVAGQPGPIYRFPVRTLDLDGYDFRFNSNQQFVDDEVSNLGRGPWHPESATLKLGTRGATQTVWVVDYSHPDGGSSPSTRRYVGLAFRNGLLAGVTVGAEIPPGTDL